MIKYAIMVDDGQFVKDTMTTSKRYKFVDSLEKATLFKDKNIAKNFLLSIKYKNIREYEHCQVVEISFTYTIKAV